MEFTGEGCDFSELVGCSKPVETSAEVSAVSLQASLL